MPLPWTEIRDKAIAFSREWQDVESEHAEAQTFWNEFFAVFGVPLRRVAFLFELYQKYTSLLLEHPKARKSKNKKKVPEIRSIRIPGQPLAAAAKNMFNECVAILS